MTEWEGSELVDVFQRFDANLDGVISRDELKTLLQALSPSSWDDNQVDLLMNAADLNDDGKIEYTEFVEWLMPKKPSNVDETAEVSGRFRTVAKTIAQAEVPCSYGREMCAEACKQLGLQLGGHGLDFAGDYQTKGCYAYFSGAYAGMAFYGLIDGGDVQDASQLNPVASAKQYRPAAIGIGCFGRLACQEAVKKLGLKLGGHGLPFAGDYKTKGCYAYYTGKYAGVAFYGLVDGCDVPDASQLNPVANKQYRPLAFDPGLACVDAPLPPAPPGGEPLDPESEEHVTDLAKSFPGYCEISDTAHRGVTLGQLRHIISYAESRCSRWKDTSKYSKTCGRSLSMDIVNLYHLNTWVIMPSTKARNCAFSELVASGKQTPTWLVSHWWGEVHADFVRCLELHVSVRGLPLSTCFWVCAYANRQHALAGEVVADPRQTSFYRAIQLCQGILLVLDSKAEFSGPATPFTRIWCAFEESVALDQDDDLDLLLDISTCQGGMPCILTDGLTEAEEQLDKSKYLGAGAKAKSQRERAFPLEVIETGLALELEKAQASVESDRTHILNCIAGTGDLEGTPPAQHPGYARINQQLRGIFAIAAWRQAVEKGQVESLKLPGVMQADMHRRALVMSFRMCPEMGGPQLSLLAKGLPPRLRRLDLDFSQCTHFGNASLAALSQGLPPALEKLSLLFVKCWQLDDSGLAALAARLPTTLKEVNLNFKKCSKIRDGGLAALGSGLEKLASLQSASLDFTECTGLGDGGLFPLASGLPRALVSCHVVFTGCTSITDLGLTGLGLGLPTELEVLRFGFAFTKIGDSGLAGLGHAVAANKGLRSLGLGFGASPQVGSAGVAAVTEYLPSGIEELSVGLDQNTRVTGDGVAAAARAISGLHSLRKLTFLTHGTSCDDAGTWALVKGLPSSVEELPLKAGAWHYWGQNKHSAEAMKHFADLASVRRWRPSVEPADPAAPAQMISEDGRLALPPPLGSGGPLAVPAPAGCTEDALAADLTREELDDHVQSVSPEEAVINVPTPCINQEGDTGDEKYIRFGVAGLGPMRTVKMQFSGIHNSHYIGINALRLFRDAQEIDFAVLTNGANAVKSSVGGWWAVAGKRHNLSLDLGSEQQITSIWLLCTNGNATPKELRVTKG